MIRAVFIDIDNTLLSFSEFVKAAIKSGFHKFGLGPYADNLFYTFERINNSLWHRLEKGELTQAQIEAVRWDMAFKELDIDFDGSIFEKYFEEQLFISAVPEPRAMEFLQYLSSKYILCAASNGPHVQQLNRLKIADMKDYFKFYFISERVGAEKPSRAFFETAFKEMHDAGMDDLKPEEVMIIGDSLTSDMAGGKGYGMKTCFYTRGREMECTDKNVDYVIKDLMEIKDVL